MALCVVPHAALAEVPNLSCAGTDPEWALTLSTDGGPFDFAGRVSEMTIPQVSRPRNLDWPLAMTLIAPRDSAIVILEAPDGPHPVRILTQRGETPLLLVGTCWPDD